ncbi:hypothetical protein F5Y13DRAFT_152851 [Hypoxylon sp. FL1857]|nr:hypothetical protein F5Y13DRAFT_152851 [Hypoxylon sp. FL1857]
MGYGNRLYMCLTWAMIFWRRGCECASYVVLLDLLISARVSPKRRKTWYGERSRVRLVKPTRRRTKLGILQK